MPDTDTPLFTLRQVAGATGWNLGTMRDHFVKGVFPWHEGDGKARAAGGTSLLSLRAAIRLGIAQNLWTLGVAPRDAFKAATIFTDFGSAPTSNEFGLSRQAGNIFPDGYDTILLWRKGEGARVMPTDEGGFVNINQFICAPFGGQSGPVVLVRVEDVVETVMAALLPEGRLPDAASKA